MSLWKILPMWLITLGTCAVGFAQQAQTPAAPGPDRRAVSNRLQRMDGARRAFRGPRPGILGPESALNLTDEQRLQQRTIMQRYFAATKVPREELFKMREKRFEGTFNAADQARARALHQEIRSSTTGIRGDMLGILTPEQRTQMETLRKERQQRREQMMKRVQGLQQKPQLD